MTKKIDLTGQRFGRLVVLEEAGRKNGKVTWLCQCQCEEETIIIVHGNSLRKGVTKSCGCFNKERAKEANIRHGQSRSKIHNIWWTMLNRCYNLNSYKYYNYGKRGIKVCERWHKFENFYEDFGKYKEEGKTIDRIDPDGDYEPDNCRWATILEQNRNTRAKGYYWNETKQKWQATIGINYKNIHLGFFDTEEEARQAYIEAKWKYHGIWLDE